MTLWPHGLQYIRPSGPSPFPGMSPSLCPLNQWCHSTISSSVTLFSYCFQSFPASESFPRSLLFTSGGQSTEASASVLPINIQGWYPLGFTGFISFLSKKAGKTTRPFRYGLNQISYTVEVTNRFKGLELRDREPEELWTEVRDTVQEAVIKTIPKKKKCKKATWLSEEALQTAMKRREPKGKGEKEKYIHLNAEFQWIARRDEKAFLSDQYK